MADVTWGFDHLVIQCADVERSLAFYCDVVGLAPERVDQWRAGGVFFASVRITPAAIIDLFPAGSMAAPADAPDDGQRLNHFCLTLDAPSFDPLLARLREAAVDIEEGPVTRWGAQGNAQSVYFKDPDGVRVEVRTYGTRAT